jgi:hypothetical protein
MKYRIWNKRTKRYIEDDVDIENRKNYNLGEYGLKPDGSVVFFESTEGGMDTYIIPAKDVEVEEIY